MVMNFVECEFQREQPFEEPGKKLYKEHVETVMYKEKTSNSTATVADNILSHHYKSNKSEDGKPTNSLTKEFEPAHILIAEPEPDILTLFKTFLDTLGVMSATVADGEAALEFFLEKENKGRPYDVVVLDTHLKGLNGLDLAKMIHDISPAQRIIIVTTTPKEYLSKNVLKSAMIKEGDILTMPFRLSDFISKLKQGE